MSLHMEDQVDSWSYIFSVYLVLEIIYLYLEWVTINEYKMQILLTGLVKYLLNCAC